MNNQKIHLKERVLFMGKILSSNLETYLLDEELELERHEEMDVFKEHDGYEQYPAGFFTSL